MKKTTKLFAFLGATLLITTTFFATIGILKAEIIYVTQDDYFIQDAIENANDGDVIVVADGEYCGEIDFLGKAITVVSENGPNNCIINSWGSFGVKFDNNESADSILQGFTITNCVAENMRGGGIYCGENTGPTIINCVITGNLAQSEYPDEAAGGGVFCDKHSSPTLINCQITNNQAVGYYGCGGGIAAVYASPQLLNCLIANNIATCNEGQGHAAGGGINFRYGSSYPILKSCMIINNTVDNYGGGLSLRYAVKATVQGCTFSENQASNGGAIYCGSGADAIIRGTILWNDVPQEIHICGEYNGSSVNIDFSDVQGGEAGITISSPYPDILVYGSMNIDADPLFRNPTTGDFHLQSSSLCIDAGQTQGWPDNYHPSGGEKDFDREPRIYDVSWVTFSDRGPVDIGADEIRDGFICGDCNGDSVIDVGDVVHLINYLFKGGFEPIPMLCVGDANGDIIVNVGDGVYLIYYLFREGSGPGGCCV
jgi:predicted outer membrane repeat protein